VIDPQCLPRSYSLALQIFIASLRPKRGRRRWSTTDPSRLHFRREHANSTLCRGAKVFQLELPLPWQSKRRNATASSWVLRSMPLRNAWRCPPKAIETWDAASRKISHSPVRAEWLARWADLVLAQIRPRSIWLMALWRSPYLGHAPPIFSGAPVFHLAWSPRGWTCAWGCRSFWRTRFGA